MKCKIQHGGETASMTSLLNTTHQVNIEASERKKRKGATSLPIATVQDIKLDSGLTHDSVLEETTRAGNKRLNKL